MLEYWLCDVPFILGIEIIDYYYFLQIGTVSLEH